MRLIVAIASVFLLQAALWSDSVSSDEVVSLERAHELALLNAPNISLAQLSALIAQEDVAIARAAYLPTISGDLTLARVSRDNTVISAGAVTTSSAYDRDAAGVMVKQLITDFGRTSATVDAVRLHAWAEGKRSQAAIEQILLQVDILYFQTLQSQERVKVAEQTVSDREDVLDRINTQVANKLKSSLDQSMAQVNLEEGKMLLIHMRNELSINRVSFAALLGFDSPQHFHLVDQEAAPPETETESALVARAIRNNPKVLRMRLELSSAQRVADSANALDYPTLSAIALAGLNADHDPRLANNYVAGGLDLNIPIYTGNLISTRQQQARLQIESAHAVLRATINDIAKDVRVALENLHYSYARFELSHKISDHANLSYDLTKTRFDSGLASIIDLDQADLIRTDAAITNSTAKEDCLIQKAILDNCLGVVHVTVLH